MRHTITQLTRNAIMLFGPFYEVATNQKGWPEHDGGEAWLQAISDPAQDLYAAHHTLTITPSMAECANMLEDWVGWTECVTHDVREMWGRQDAEAVEKDLTAIRRLCVQTQP